MRTTWNLANLATFQPNIIRRFVVEITCSSVLSLSLLTPLALYQCSHSIHTLQFSKNLKIFWKFQVMLNGNIREKRINKNQTSTIKLFHNCIARSISSLLRCHIWTYINMSIASSPRLVHLPCSHIKHPKI